MDETIFSDRFAGRRRQLIDLILQRVRTLYQGFAVTVAADRDAVPEPFTTIYVTAGRPAPELSAALGLAEKIDQYNTNPSDAALVFANGDPIERFSARLKTLDLEQALRLVGHLYGNIIAHEVGHLLGMIHTIARADLMFFGTEVSVSGDLVVIENPTFTVAPLADFSLGLQDGALLLTEIVGLGAEG